MYALRRPNGPIWLVVDGRGVSVALEQWDLGDSQLLRRNSMHDPWVPVGQHELRAMRRLAERERSERQLQLVEEQESACGPID